MVTGKARTTVQKISSFPLDIILDKKDNDITATLLKFKSNEIITGNKNQHAYRRTIMNLKTTLSIIAIGLAAGIPLQNHAATWGGGTGDWNSAGVDNWGMGIGVYPGDGANETEPTLLTSGGTVAIGTGDSINLTSGQNFQTATTTVNQSGGALTVGNNVRVGNAWNLSGGSMTFSAGMQFFNQGSGAEVNVSGGTFSTTALQWRGLGDISVSGGSFTATGVIDLGFDEVNGGGSISIIGSGATTVQANAIQLSGGTLTKTANFTFDNSGVNYWNVIGGGTGTLSIDNSAFLNVDLGSYDAVNGDRLFTYNILGSSVTGAFDTANISITGDSYGAFSLGASAGALNPGEYFIDYDVDIGGSDGAVVLYANNIPEPSTFALMGISLLVLTAFVRRKSI